MNLHLLRMFLAVVDERGFSRAGEALHVSQSAVSKGVRELENQLGLKLIEDRRDIRLTEAGEALLPHARSLFALERAAAGAIDDRLRLRRGRLQVGASTTIAGYWLPAAVAAFAERHPGVAVELAVGNTAEIAQRVCDCAVDIGFVEGDVELPGLRCTAWREDPLDLIAAAGDRMTDRIDVESLSARAWLVREDGSGTRQVTDAFLARHGITPRSLCVLGSNEAIVRAVAESSAVAIVPRRVAQELLDTGRVRSLQVAGTQPPVRCLYCVELAGRARTPAVDAFMGLAGAH